MVNPLDEALLRVHNTDDIIKARSFINITFYLYKKDHFYLHIYLCQIIFLITKLLCKEEEVFTNAYKNKIIAFLKGPTGTGG